MTPCRSGHTDCTADCGWCKGTGVEPPALPPKSGRGLSSEKPETYESSADIHSPEASGRRVQSCRCSDCLAASGRVSSPRCECPGCSGGVHEHLVEGTVLLCGAVADIPHTYGYWTMCKACDQTTPASVPSPHTPQVDFDIDNDNRGVVTLTCQGCDWSLTTRCSREDDALRIFEEDHP